MLNKQILVSTTSTIEGRQIKEYIKPVSAHIVAGTNMYSDFLASFSDVFGGRSATYQRQLRSLYSEAIERLKASAFEVGANCILGLKIDMDEISGKGKSMFMITAIGTAVIIENSVKQEDPRIGTEKLENVDLDRINQLRIKREILRKGQAGTIIFDDETWSFITTNQVHEAYDAVIAHIILVIKNYNDMTEDAAKGTFKKAIAYIGNLPIDHKYSLVYNSLSKENNETLIDTLLSTVKELQLLDLDKIIEFLNSPDFEIQKRGLKLLSFDKEYYNKEDVVKFRQISELINKIFVERGVRSFKKQMLSSKPKEVWTCECGKVNDIDTICNGCSKDIMGFKSQELTSKSALTAIEEKISLIEEYIDLGDIASNFG